MTCGKWWIQQMVSFFFFFLTHFLPFPPPEEQIWATGLLPGVKGELQPWQLSMLVCSWHLVVREQQAVSQALCSHVGGNRIAGLVSRNSLWDPTWPKGPGARCHVMCSLLCRGFRVVYLISTSSLGHCGSDCFNKGSHSPGVRWLSGLLRKF